MTTRDELIDNVALWYHQGNHIALLPFLEYRSIEVEYIVFEASVKNENIHLDSNEIINTILEFTLTKQPSIYWIERALMWFVSGIPLNPVFATLLRDIVTDKRFSQHYRKLVGYLLKEYSKNPTRLTPLERIELLHNADAEEQYTNIFLTSWDGIEQFYNDLQTRLGWKWVECMIPFVKELRSKQYDTVTRAGQSLYSLIVSRSKVHGLRDEQAFVAFTPQNGVHLNVGFHRGVTVVKELYLETIGITSEIEQLLSELIKQKID